MFCTVHPESVDALFEAAAQIDQMRLIAGKVLMDRKKFEALCDNADTGYADSKAFD